MTISIKYYFNKSIKLISTKKFDIGVPIVFEYSPNWTKFALVINYTIGLIDLFQEDNYYSTNRSLQFHLKYQLTN